MKVERGDLKITLNPRELEDGTKFEGSVFFLTEAEARELLAKLTELFRDQAQRPMGPTYGYPQAAESGYPKITFDTGVSTVRQTWGVPSSTCGDGNFESRTR